MIDPDIPMTIRFSPGDVPELPELGVTPDEKPERSAALDFLDERCHWKPIGDIF